VLYTTSGFCSVEVAGEPPGNSQLKLVLFEDEVLVNCTVNAAQPEVTFDVKLAVGPVNTVTVLVEVLVPQVLVAVSTTV
jgi:hypothetical protein